jgi:hypothetical protein
MLVKHFSKFQEYQSGNTKLIKKGHTHTHTHPHTHTHTHTHTHKRGPTLDAFMSIKESTLTGVN